MTIPSVAAIFSGQLSVHGEVAAPLVRGMSPLVTVFWGHEKGGEDSASLPICCRESTFSPLLLKIASGFCSFRSAR